MSRSGYRERTATAALHGGQVSRSVRDDWAGVEPPHTYKECAPQLVLRPDGAQLVPTVSRLLIELVALISIARYAHLHHWNFPWWLPLGAATILFARAGWIWLGLKTDSAVVDRARITFHRGVLNRASSSVEFARIQNVLAFQAWWQRPFRIGTVLIQTTDRSSKNWAIAGVSRPHEMRERILRAALATRHYHGTSEALIGAL